MRFGDVIAFEVVQLDTDPALCTVGVPVANEGGGEGDTRASPGIVLPWSNATPDGRDLGTAGGLLMALVYFPSSACFLKTWADDELAKVAFPLRAPMLAEGFEHVWLRCAEAR